MHDLLPLLRRWADLLDSRFVVPGTTIRFGIDPLLSLVPGLGDLASPAYTVLLLVQGTAKRVPRAVLVRMVVNALFDALIGAVPIVGNVGDIFFRANARNFALLERHARPGVPPTKGDVAFLWGAAAVLGLLVALPLFAAIAVWWTIARWIAG